MNTSSIGGVKAIPREGGHVVEMQRRRLLSAMVEVLPEHGFEGAGVGRVCEQAGVSRRTFYDLFEDREACFLAAFELALQQIGEKVIPQYARKGRWHERIRGGLAALLECFDDHPELAWLCTVETLKGGSPVLERRRRLLGALIAAVDEGREHARSAHTSSLIAESTVGGAVAVIHARLVEHDRRSLVGLLNPLMSMIVHPYLGSAASRRELDRPLRIPEAASASNGQVRPPARDPFKNLSIRITFRTARVLATIAERPGASNRELAMAAGVVDQGQMSKLLRRLQAAALIENHGEGQTKGQTNAWQLTIRGCGVLQVIGS
jgi:AcrR family transcriptional regulator